MYTFKIFLLCTYGIMITDRDEYVSFQSFFSASWAGWRKTTSQRQWCESCEACVPSHHARQAQGSWHSHLSQATSLPIGLWYPCCLP